MKETPNKKTTATTTTTENGKWHYRKSHRKPRGNNFGN